MSDSKQRASINLNDYIYVRLTPRGLALYRARCAPNYPMPEPDAEGLYGFQLWKFMELFAGRLLCGQYENAVLESMNAEVETREVPGNTVEVSESDTPILPAAQARAQAEARREELALEEFNEKFVCALQSGQSRITLFRATDRLETLLSNAGYTIEAKRSFCTGLQVTW